jgi:hypothetical protein
MKFAIFIGAYGRDYLNKDSATRDFNNDMDFILTNRESPLCNKPCNKSSLKAHGYTHAEIRYKGKTRLVVVEL